MSQNRGRGISGCVFVVVLVMLLSSSGYLQAQQPNDQPELQADILTIDDSVYPQIQLYVSVVDTTIHSPLEDIPERNFQITVNDNQLIGIQNLTETRRPVHLMLVMDLTASVTPTELGHMREASQNLVEGLQAGDQVGLVTVNHQSAELLQPLSSDRDVVLAALKDEALRPAEGGQNVVGDGIYRAVTALPSASGAVRPTTVILTDATPDGIQGEHNLDDSRLLAQKRGVAIHVMYFGAETGSEALEVDTLPPAELVDLARSTDGFVFWQEGEFLDEVDEADYTDDRFLPELATQLVAILNHEYRIELDMPLVADDDMHDLAVVVRTNGQTGRDEGRFQARQDRLETSPTATAPTGAAIVPTETSGVSAARDQDEATDALPGIAIAPVDDIRDSGANGEAQGTDDDGEDSGTVSLGVALGIILAVVGALAVLSLLVLRRRKRIKRLPSPPTREERFILLQNAGETQAEHDGVDAVAPALLVGENGVQYPLYEGENTLGRHEDNLVQIMDITVSRHHAVITVRNDTYIYQDREATHPTEISGYELKPDEEYPLVDGDSILIGSTKLRFILNKNNQKRGSTQTEPGTA